MKKNILLVILCLSALWITSCVSHLSPEKLIPTTDPTVASLVVKTPAPRIVAFDEATTLWDRCAALGTSEDLESGMLSQIEPPLLRERIMMRLEIQPEEVDSTIISRRCAGGALLVCNSTRYPYCVEKINIDPLPSEAMRRVCLNESMDGLTLPSMVIGSNNAYEWTCVNSEPVRGEMVLFPDAQGYNPNIWFPVEQE